MPKVTGDLSNLYYQIMSKQGRNSEQGYVPGDPMADAYTTPFGKLRPSALYSTHDQAMREMGADPKNPQAVAAFEQMQAPDETSGDNEYPLPQRYNPYRMERYGSKK